MLKQSTIEQNEYAQDKFGRHVYILDVESGQKGYWCIGCGNEMQAVHGSIEHRKKYFRHVAKDVNVERKCTFSNEEFRHKLAIEILQFTKRIKVPNLYSYSQDGKTKVLLEESNFVEADHVRAELTFYEDDDGNVKWGKNPDIEERNLLIRPDLTFFNPKGEPLLLLEIVVSHKIDDEKKVKLKRLGINTIQIKIPKDSEENIRKSLETSNYTQWVYNNEQERNNFIQLSKRDRAEILPSDEHERKLFGESFECRKSEIGNLIRTIEKCLGSQRYRHIVEQFEQELSRVETNTASNREGLDELRNSIRERVNARHKDTLEPLEREEKEYEAILDRESSKLQRDFDSAKRAEESNYTKLEDRYLRKREELISAERESESEKLNIETSIKSIEGGERDFGAIQQASGRIQTEIDGIERRRISIRDEFESDRRRIESKYDQYTRQEQARHSRDYGAIKERIDSLHIEFEEKGKELSEYFRKEEDAIERGYQNYGEQLSQFMEGENSFGSQMSDRIKKLFDTKRILCNWEETYSTCQRYRIAIECIRKRDYKKWN